MNSSSHLTRRENEAAPRPRPIIRSISQAAWAGAKRQAPLPNGITLAYVEMGDPAGRPLLLVHGYTDSSRSWSLAAPFLADGRRLIVVDLRGHGTSTAPRAGYSVSDMVQDLRLFLDYLRIGRVDFVGHSLGSMIGQVFAQRHAGRVSKLVLIGSTLSATQSAGPGSWLWDNAHALTDPIDPASPFIVDFTTNPTPVDLEFTAYARREACAIPTRIWHAVLEELAGSDFGALSWAIAAPTLIIWGGKDPLFGAEDQAALQQTIKDSSFVAFQSLGHNPQWEDPAGIAAAIARFLA